VTIHRPQCRLGLSVVLDGRGRPNTKPLYIPAQPRSCTVSRNGYSEADTWTADFDARHLPIDPDLIASLSARVYMWDGQDGDEGKEWATLGHEMIRGLADEPEMNVGIDDGAITVAGRDYTAVLDPEWNPRHKVPSGRPLDETIQYIADSAAPPGTAARFLVDWQATDQDGWPVTPPICGGLTRSTKKKGQWVKAGKTHWEVIYDLAIAHGFIVYVRDSTIIVQNPATQTRATLAQAPAMIYGKNIVSLNVTRKLARNVVPTIVIVAWDPKQRKQVEVKYPADKNDVITALKVERDQIERVPAPKGIFDVDSLRRYARMRHDMLGRCEAVYKVKTRHLAAPAPNGDMRDLLRLQAGDPVSINFDPFNGEAMRKLERSQRVEHLRALGYGAALSSFVAEHFDRLEQFRQPYYVRTATYTYDANDGLEIEIEAVNYASEAREDHFAGIRSFGSAVLGTLVSRPIGGGGEV